jgi:hypothetical protein
MIILLAVLLGCGQPAGPAGTPGEPGKVEELVYATAAKWADQEKFDELFVEGSVPAEKERLKFQGKSVQPDNVTIDGDTATIDVTVTVFVDGEPNSTSLKWEAAKQGEDWKLTRAPLE